MASVPRSSVRPRPALAARVGDIAPFHVMEVQTAARALEARGRSVVHMEIGEPDFPTPAPVLAAARAALDDGGIYYTSALGIEPLREAIARHYRGEEEGVAVTPGLDFGRHRAGEHVRFAYTIALPKIDDGLERIARFLARRQYRVPEVSCPRASEK
jgi:aspartate/methionine/tyrosine aminotransferase